jgi:hypothetical protein
MGVLARRGAACIFNPYHPAEGTEGLGNGITYEIHPPLDTCPTFNDALKWGSNGPEKNKYPLFSWWKGNNPSTGQTDGAWFPQGPHDRVSKKKGGGQVDIAFGLNLSGFAYVWGYPYWTPQIGSANYTGLGKHILWNVGGYQNPPFTSGTEYKANTVAKETYKKPGQDPTAPIIYWYENTETINVDGTVTPTYEEVGHSNTYDPTTDGWTEWYTDVNGYKHYWKEIGSSINSDFFNKNDETRNYSNPEIVVRDSQEDDYPAYNISSTAATVEPDYGILYEAYPGSLVAYETSRYMCWNTPTNDYSYRRDCKTMKLELTAYQLGDGCDTGCSYAGKKFKFKLKYQEGDMTIALNGTPTFTGTPIQCLKSSITWGAYTEIDITAELKLEDWITTHPKQLVWSTTWDEDVIARGKARRLIDIYLVSIEDS